MKKLKAGLSVLLFILVLAYALAFAANNSLPVELDFLIGSPLTLPVSVWLALALFSGVVVGIFSNMAASARHRLALRQLKKELSETKQRLSKLP
ncbi:MAG: LapA family protein [Pseudomonadota bacterium]|nr:LapA family protein [Pseudomonadota bacterium]